MAPRGLEDNGDVDLRHYLQVRSDDCTLPERVVWVISHEYGITTSVDTDSVCLNNMSRSAVRDGIVLSSGCSVLKMSVQ
jgi:hypothetical protein